jgi:hypothetical protein
VQRGPIKNKLSPSIWSLSSSQIHGLPSFPLSLSRATCDDSRCRVFGYARLSDMTCYSIKSFLLIELIM